MPARRRDPALLACGAIVLALGHAHDLHAQDRRAGGVEIQQPTCRCCIASPAGACCRDACNVASLRPNMSPIPLVGLALVAKNQPAARKEAVPDPLASCAFRNALKIANYPEASAAKEFYALASVEACDRFVPTLLRQRRDILDAFASRTLTERQIATSRTYADTCLAPVASIYKAALTTDDIQKIAAQIVLLVVSDGRPYCHGFRVGQHVVTADHCLRGKALGDAVHVRTIASPARLGATVVFRGGEDNSRRPDKDQGLLKLNEPAATDVAADLAWLGEPLANARLLLVQVNAYKQIAAGVALDAGFEPLLSIEDNPACRLFGVSPQGFLLNGCQSDSGTSGTPYIQKDAEGRLRLVGVHGGQTRVLKDAALVGCSVSLPNYGVKLPIPELRRLMGVAN